jgi:hypothetical protein
MRSPVRYVTYLIISILSLASLIYYFINIKVWDLYGYNLGYVVLVGSLIYTIYMFFREILQKEHRIVDENVVINDPALHGKNFMTDTFHKFIFCFAFADFIFYIIYILRVNFNIYDTYPSQGYLLVDVYTNLILPVYLILDLFITHRFRHVHHARDILILLLLVVIHFSYKFSIYSYVYLNTKVFFPILSDYIIIFLLTLNGYVLYDYLLFKKNHARADNYHLLQKPIEA